MTSAEGAETRIRARRRDADSNEQKVVTLHGKAPPSSDHTSAATTLSSASLTRDRNSFASAVIVSITFSF